MTAGVRASVSVATIALMAAAAGLTLDAHKPITSPYTFNEDVFPILRDRCAACHVTGGIAPMALTTAEETVPWGESIRLQLVAGQMPPWAAMADGRRLRHAEGLTARELNLLLTWVTGGTPTGAADKTPPALAPAAGWPLGPPDTTLVLPDVTITAGQTDVVRELTVPLGAAAGRPLRAVDLRPGTAAIVRSAQVLVRDAAGARMRTIAWWVPGDATVALPAGVSFTTPPGGEIVVRLRYKKTWQHEREVMTDRSTIGLYFADATGSAVEERAVAMPAAAAGAEAAASVVLDAHVRGLAITPTASAAGLSVTVDAQMPDGRRQRVLAFTPRAGWMRRYWFETPLTWPRGTELHARFAFDEGTARPPAGTPLLVVETTSARSDDPALLER